MHAGVRHSLNSTIDEAGSGLAIAGSAFARVGSMATVCCVDSTISAKSDTGQPCFSPKASRSFYSLRLQ